MASIFVIQINDRTLPGCFPVCLRCTPIPQIGSIRAPESNWLGDAGNMASFICEEYLVNQSMATCFYRPTASFFDGAGLASRPWESPSSSCQLILAASERSSNIDPPPLEK